MKFYVNLKDKFLQTGGSYLTAVEFKLVKTNSLATESGNLSIYNSLFIYSSFYKKNLKTSVASILPSIILRRSASAMLMLNFYLLKLTCM